MQHVQNLPLPPSLKGLEDNNEVKKLTEIKPVKPVSERVEPALVFRQITQSEHQQTRPKPIEKRNAGPYQGERRVICRRIKKQPLLKELRSKMDRRRRQQRKTDMAEHVDEVA